jgi:hypothetical protein
VGTKMLNFCCDERVFLQGFSGKGMFQAWCFCGEVVVICW